MLINRLQTLKNDRFYISAIMLAISTIVFIASYMIYAEPRLEPNFDAKRSTDVQSCIDFASHKGFDTKKQGLSVIEISDSNLGYPKLMFTKVETVVAACHNVELKSFCLGVESECGLNGLKMVMVYEGPDVF
jgi:hypothetical protein